jgi:hypothetical protein
MYNGDHREESRKWSAAYMEEHRGDSTEKLANRGKHRHGAIGTQSGEPIMSQRGEHKVESTKRAGSQRRT